MKTLFVAVVIISPICTIFVQTPTYLENFFHSLPFLFLISFSPLTKKYFLEGHAGPILTADFTFDKRVITGSRDKTIKYWDFSRQYCKFTFQAYFFEENKLKLTWEYLG